MKRKFLVFTLLYLSFCLLITGCGGPSPEIPGTDATQDSDKPAKPVIDPEDSEPMADPEDTEPEDPESNTESDTEPVEPDLVSLIGNIKNPSKVVEDLEAGTVTLKQKIGNTAPPSFTFFHDGAELTDNAWAVTGTINIKTTATLSGHIVFIANRDSENLANIFISRRVNGSNGIWRNITLNGVRTPASTTTNENVSNTLVDATDWTGDFAFVYYDGRVSLYLKVEGGEFELMTYYDTDWETCTAEFAVNQYADATLSEMNVLRGEANVKKLRDGLDGIPENPLASKKVLFIGNSATYVNDVPGTLSRLAKKAGYVVEVNSVTLGGATLTDHANATTDHGKEVLDTIARGNYDIVVIQDNGNCVSSDTMRASSKEACKTLNTAISAAGAQTYIYVRPPYGYSIFGYTPIQQSAEFDKLFNEIAAEIGADNVYVNRAFAYAIQELKVNLWGPDNAHTSPEGAYLAVCVFFSTLFNTSSTVLDANGLPEDLALSLQQAADKVVLEQYKSW